MTKRRKSRTISVGNVLVGGDQPVRVQSMTNTDTRDISATVSQIKRLEALGCEIARAAVPNIDAAKAIKQIAPQITVPLIADVHFKHTLAIESLKNGASAVRINPGNIGGKGKTLEVIACAKDLGRSIRIGINSGSLEKDLLAEYGVSAEALVKSALRQTAILEETGFKQYKVSIKASNVPTTVQAYKMFAALSDAPLHIGITEAGAKRSGAIKSAVGIGTLLLSGIGDTIRVSLTAPPEEEIPVAWEILRSSGARRRGVEVISCPTCGRTEINVIKLAEEVEKACADINREIIVAVMGCSVNGPGEAREADYGIAGGKGCGILFHKDKALKKVGEGELLQELIKLINGNG